MPVTMNFQYVHTRESQIDDKLEDLLGKLVTGELSREDEVLYNQLVAQRTRMMRPVVRKLPQRQRRRLYA